MGEYNPHLPRILGQEWVPIRDELTTFAPAVNAVEYGHEFTLTSSKVLSTGRLYVQEPAPAASRQQFWISVYPSGDENASGPIKQLIIPVTSGAVTGTGVTAFPSVAGALYSPADSNYINITTPDGNLKQISMFFNVDAYAQELYNKRILDLSLLYSGYSFQRPNDVDIPMDTTKISDSLIQVLSGSGLSSLGFGAFGPVIGYTNTVQPAGTEIYRVAMGQYTFDTATTGALPLTFADLQRFQSSTALATRWNTYFSIVLDSTADSTTEINISYAAMLVTYCEEKRSAVGAFHSPLNLGMNAATMYSPLAKTANPVLAAGNYVATLATCTLGDLDTEFNVQTQYPGLNAVRELYELPPHEGIQINVPFPPTERVGEQFTVEDTHILPQLSLHTSGGPLTEVHVYGRQAVARVYGTQVATQEIYDSPVGSAQSFPWVRFYARRWGDTTVALTLDSPTIVGSSTSITVDEFDALDEILDGWKEVTLRFNTPPSMGTGTNPIWRWSASGETVGNHWEVLGATAPAISGVPGNLFNLVPSPNQLSIATYGAPVSGAPVNLSWLPQYAPPISGATDDQTSDAALIFSMDMPTVTGFSVIGASQAVSGIGQDCGLDPCGIPTAINYNQLSWSATSSSIPASGFGYYEMQRMDEVDTDWATIMKSTSPTGATFNDYEARIGLQSDYRIRAVDIYEFPGLWSDTITITPAAPGVSGSCLDSGQHVLVFTSNEQQDGSVNLAYSTVWEGRVEEGFTFVEAGFVQLQAMYDRDFFTAFRPMERGGDRFQRQLLVQAAAIAPETLSDFTNLRDMAWADVSYICVRDEEGNKWLATVMVPDARVVFRRRIYMAPVDIVEVTTTPSPVDPYA